MLIYQKSLIEKPKPQPLSIQMPTSGNKKILKMDNTIPVLTQ